DLDAERGDGKAARREYDAALALQREIGERQSITSTLVSLADLDRREHDAARARDDADEALVLARAIDRPELEWTARRAIAAIDVDDGHPEAAIAELQASARIVTGLRANVGGDSGRIAYVDRRQEVFGELASLLVARGRAADALEAAEAG